MLEQNENASASGESTIGQLVTYVGKVGHKGCLESPRVAWSITLAGSEFQSDWYCSWYETVLVYVARRTFRKYLRRDLGVDHVSETWHEKRSSQKILNETDDKGHEISK